MYNLILIAAGGALGSLFRYFSTFIFKSFFYNELIGTLFVNFVGSFFIGILISILNIKVLSEEIIKYFLIVGFLGSFTTFSTFSYEVIEMFINKKIFIASIYVIFSLILCFSGVYLGLNLLK